MANDSGYHLRCVPFIIREIFTFLYGMSAHDDNFLYKAQATTKPNDHFIGLDQL